MVINRKYYTLHLKTLSPVHIGSGVRTTSKEFIFENDNYYFPDMVKLYSELEKLGDEKVERFEQFMIRNHSNEARLTDFLNNNKIKTRDFGGYSINSSGYEESKAEQTGKTHEKNRAKLKEIHRCIKDPYGKPYIPGSSLKGAIRTILVNQKFKKDNRGRGKYTEANYNAIPWGSKKNQPFFDIFNNIRVSDSDSVELDRLILAQKIDFSKKQNVDSPLPLTRECIKPFTNIFFTVTAVGDEAIDLMDNYSEMANSQNNEYENFFLSEFPSDLKQAKMKNTIYIGAGSGLWTKTLLSESNNIIKEVNYRAPKKMNMVGKGTLKLTRGPNVVYKVNGNQRKLVNNKLNLYEMGKCAFVLKEKEVPSL
ncbi:type III-A CRISPR-associated RAMP protein Csm5 [Fundicoccus culcitae]|uniref:CRISPR system Cms protein Csm5 n=1 Tax=Fundicoccus culcitae TaxID=2969821 RepID=A0ABY5P543_9LACT|nr:type III-A CRISPR-associated RAMP protein Csm5 [Fundicoccus culcitae]UUX33730.1 type III-A CRISPR-associated RAMP protein Csm5 [Fundicoccus culcitae]